MPLPVQNQKLYWSLAGLFFLLIFWFLGDVLLPFVLGAAIAYLLDPIADRLQARGLSRVMSVLIITITALVILLPAAIFVLNTIIIQTSALASINFSFEKVAEIEAILKSILPNSLGANLDLQQNLQQFEDFVRPRAQQIFDSFGKNILGALMASAVSLVNILMLLVIVPVVTVYMLLDWDNMTARIDSLLPRDHAEKIRLLAQDIDSTLAAFVRGMGSVCLILGTYYAVSLWIIGLSFGFAVGFFAGLITFIPYLGSLMGGALAIGLGVFEFWGEWNKLALVAGVFFIGQIFEGNFLTPKLVGDSVGLHPVWLLLALSVFGSLFGFVGMLIAVPVAASLGVLVRFGASQYTAGRLYKGAVSKETKK